MKILAIESSCDETSIAIVENGKTVLSNIISSQIDIHQTYGGVVPEIASRHHLKNIAAVLEESLTKANCSLNSIDAFAVTATPGLVGALLTGISFAKGLAYSDKKMLIPVHHMRAHIYANFIEHEITLPAIALVVSGGHTQIVKMDQEHHFTLLGESVDDAVGECYDKVARILELGYPGGPIIDRLAREGRVTYTIPKAKVEGEYNFSFSGIKTYMLNLINQHRMREEPLPVADIAASFQYSVVESLVEKVMKAANAQGINTILLAGGVAANSQLRERLKEVAEKENKKVFYPKMAYCTDNAAMVAVAAYYKWQRFPQHEFKNYYALNAKATCSIEQDI